MKAKRYKIIAIDGPSSSGKGTVAKLVANKLGFSYLDSGAIYRSLGLLSIRQNIKSTDIVALLAIVKQMCLTFKDSKVYLDKEDITKQIRSEAVGMVASSLGRDKLIREALLEFQHKFADLDDLVTDGRDMASVIFPNADLKVFLTASVEERAKRRYNQLQQLTKSGTMEAILDDILTRDKQDSERVYAPLKLTDSYKLLDSTHLTTGECAAQIVSWYNERAR